MRQTESAFAISVVCSIDAGGNIVIAVACLAGRRGNRRRRL